MSHEKIFCTGNIVVYNFISFSFEIAIFTQGPGFKLFLEKKKKKKSENVINTCVSLIKQHCQKMAEIPQKRDFLTWSIQNFVRKKKLL